ncbi:gas vesicle protein [Luteimonas granuli]|uniref:Gas vesicle protein n=1 Tax=Luteimonas granuli TaxID=1176533 RepID=A0A518N339_9GAMM|nr:gas vesicle protein [Luteimonas granuli]QDW66355.1 gas vesicle protein [Luteimonas granuli]
MSPQDQAEGRNDPKAGLSARLAIEGQSVDWFLQELVEFVNRTEGNEIGLTLHVEGAIVTGTLVNARRWFQELSEFLESQGVDAGLAEWIGGYSEVYAQRDELPDDEKSPPVFLHLRAARTVGTSGDSVPTDEGVYWRGRVNAVSGFSFGTFGPAAHR